MIGQRPQIEWSPGGVPVATRFGDPYFSLENGLEEARHVFVDGNRLPERLGPGFHVAEIGFGTGLNLIALADAATCPVRFTSFEAYPIAGADARRALCALLGPDPRVDVVAGALDSGATEIQIGPVSVSLILGDVRDTLPDWQGLADAWFLDGFAPAKNPDAWTPDVIRAVASHTAPGGTFATFTAAGSVRRAAAEAGFRVERRPGFGRKRHMTVGSIP